MNAPLTAKDLYGSSMAECLLDMACRRSDVIRRTIAGFGDRTLMEYLDGTMRMPNDPFQRPGDVTDVVYDYVTRLLGAGLAKRVCEELEACPVVLTTNHHGVDFFAQSVQGSLIFSLRMIRGRCAQTVPVFACGGIPLDNLTYPQGLLLYDTAEAQSGTLPQKLPVFSNRLRRRTASVAPSIQAAMIERARRRAATLAHDHVIPAPLADTLRRIFDEDYSAAAVTSLPTYSEQAVVLNHRIWKRLFADSTRTTDLVYLELEKIATALLARDLFDAHSLMYCVLFDPRLREQVVNGLDAVSACWTRSKLMQRATVGFQGGKAAHLNQCGTTFFWGINDRYRKVPLCLGRGRTGMVLRGVDDKAREFVHPFDPVAIDRGLREKRLLPSLFTCFLTLSLARGVTCLGGYYQADYLPAIQRGVVEALRACGGYHDMAEHVAHVHTKGYLGGMQAVLLRHTHDCMLPAGPAEISAGGGLTVKDFEQIRSCSVRDAHIASLFETIPDLGLGHMLPENWKSELALDCARRLSGTVVCKSLGAPTGTQSRRVPVQELGARDRSIGMSISSILDKKM